jgi:stage III sporulation protein SpoIIIAA
VGKTTAIREVSRTLSDVIKKRVVIVDTSNEIGGDGDIPHDGIGRARRMQVRAAGRGPFGFPTLPLTRAWVCLHDLTPRFHPKYPSSLSPSYQPAQSQPQVQHPDMQHRVMVEAVENHMPEVIIIDEIGTEAECVAARTIAQRGEGGGGRWEGGDPGWWA